MTDETKRELEEIAGYFISGKNEHNKKGYIIRCIPAGPDYPFSMKKLNAAISLNGFDSAFISVSKDRSVEAEYVSAKGDVIPLSFDPETGNIEELSRTLDFLLLGYDFSAYSGLKIEDGLYLSILYPSETSMVYKSYCLTAGLVNKVATGVIIASGFDYPEAVDFFNGFNEILIDNTGYKTEFFGSLNLSGEGGQDTLYRIVATSIVDYFES